jgi:hypothetical protein
MRKSNDKILKESIEMMVGRLNLGEGLQQAKLEKDWEQLFGKTVAKYTTQIKLHNKKLSFHIEPAPLKAELNFNRANLILKINEHYQQIVVFEIIIY